MHFEEMKIGKRRSSGAPKDLRRTVQRTCFAQVDASIMIVKTGLNSKISKEILLPLNRRTDILPSPKRIQTRKPASETAATSMRKYVHSQDPFCLNFKRSETGVNMPFYGNQKLLGVDLSRVRFSVNKSTHSDNRGYTQ